MENCFQHFKELIKQIKHTRKSVIDYLKEEDFTTLFFLTEKNSCDTFKSKDDSLIKLLFAKLINFPKLTVLTSEEIGLRIEE